MLRAPLLGNERRAAKLIVPTRSWLAVVPLPLLVPYLTCCELLYLQQLQRSFRRQQRLCELILRFNLYHLPRQPAEIAVSVVQRLLPPLARVERLLLQDHAISPHHLSLLLPLLLADYTQWSLRSGLLHSLLLCCLPPAPSKYTERPLCLPSLPHVQLLLNRWSSRRWVEWWRSADCRVNGWRLFNEHTKAQVEADVRTILLELDGRMSWIGTNSKQQQSLPGLQTVQLSVFGYYLGEVQTVSIRGRRHAYSSSSVPACHPSAVDWSHPSIVCFHFVLHRLVRFATVDLCYYPSLAAYLLASSSSSSSPPVPVSEHSPFLLSALEKRDCKLMRLSVSAYTYRAVREALFAVERVRELRRQWKQLQQHKEFVWQRPVDVERDEQLQEMQAAIVEAESECRKLKADE